LGSLRALCSLRLFFANFAFKIFLGFLFCILSFTGFVSGRAFSGAEKEGNENAPLNAVFPNRET
jgi:hypothetical protein